MTKLPMAQGDLLLLLPLGWQQYRDRQPALANYKKKYTAALATEALARLKTAADLPDEQARTATSERLRGELTEQGTEFLGRWNLLDGYIEEAYPGAVACNAMREAAGHDHYEAAAGRDWGALQVLQVEYNLASYPFELVDLLTHKRYKCADEAAFEAALRSVLSSDGVRQAAGMLLTQSKSE